MARSNNGGIAGSGIFGGIGSVVQCKAEDDSLYCKFAKLMNIIVWIITIAFILYILKGFLKA
jgi:hypothetical protein